MRFFLPLLCILLPAWTLAQTSPGLSYTQVQFDSDTCCWRRLSAAGEHRKAGMLIAAYLKTNNVRNAHALNWHAGQLFAKADDRRLALRYIGKTYNIFYRWLGGEDGKAWYFYAKGTSAFLRRNKRQLDRIIRKWNRKLPKDLNYNQLVLLQKYWTKGYGEALK